MTAARDCRFAWYPDQETIAQSKLTEFLGFAGVPDAETLAQRSAADPGWLWDTVIRYADIAFFRPYDTIMDNGTDSELHPGRSDPGSRAAFL